jgi:predicted Zn-dependent protease
VIRLVTLDPIEREVIDKLCRIVFQAYGLGCEYAGDVPVPKEAVKGDSLDAVELLAKAQAVKSFADDKTVYLTTRPFLPRELPSGKAPTSGFAAYSGERAVVTTSGLPEGEALLKRLAKQVVHDVGHLWELHHCLDPRCSMYATWTPSFVTGEPVLCPFCRDKSEQKIRMAKT